jgi:hypothetical protein
MAHKRWMRNVYKILVAGREHLENKYVQWRIIIEWILKKVSGYGLCYLAQGRVQW